MGADLVGAHYPTNFDLDSYYGQARNTAQANVPIRSNLEYIGVGTLTDTTAQLSSGVMQVVPIPVDEGTTVTKISFLTGATAVSFYPGDGAQSFAAIYQGSGASPALIGQSTAAASAAMGASTRIDFSLTTPYVIGANANDAPYGYVFAAIMVKATTPPSMITAGGTQAEVAQYLWFPNMAGFGSWQTTGAHTSRGPLSFTAGSSLAAAAPSTLVWASTKTTAPIVFLW